MAEYYPLLSRAVAGLRDGAPEARHAIYGRARQALIGQLRGMQPPVPEEAIAKETTALDDAIARIEAEMPPPPRSVSDAASAAVEAALLFDAPPPATMPVPLPAEAAPVPVTPSVEPAAAVALKPPVNRPAPAARAERPLFAPRPSLPGGSRLVRQEPPPAPAAAPSSEADKEAAAAKATVEPSTSDDAPVLPTAPTLESVLIKRDGDVTTAAVPEPSLAVDAAAIDAPVEVPSIEIRNRDDGLRPAMPRQVAAQPRNLRVWIVAVAALAAVVVIALTAWKLRDNPEELARVPTPVPQAEQTPGKIVERADGTAPSEDEAADAAAASATTSASPTANAPQAAVTPVPVPSAGTAAQPASEQAIPVSYKAAVLVAAPDTPEKVRTYVGTVVWRSEGGTNDPGAAVRADIDVPDAKLQMTMEIRKNTEAQFPASHTIDIKFTPGPGSPLGAVKQIDVPQMRREDAPTGDPLVGVPVTITNNSFLVGLTRGDAERRNVEALRTRGWFDIPLVLEDGKPAKITFEKGASGDRILADALTAWAKN